MELASIEQPIGRRDANHAILASDEMVLFETPNDATRESVIEPRRCGELLLTEARAPAVSLLDCTHKQNRS